MPSLSGVTYYATHPGELRSIIQWKLWHQPVHERDEDKECLELRVCFDYLDKTSRSFAAVIKELHPELLVPICLFYLILRGLDTVEDDMTIPLEDKEPVLRNFHTILEKDGWTYTGNHSKEKDRDLLVNFHYVITEFKKIKPAYQVIIRDITDRMGNGMADYCNNAEHNVNGVDSIADYEKYCHYVAGLVGEGLTRLFVESGLANPALLERPELHESMGQLLQQVNIIRDIKEDWDEKRRFWPKEIWSKHVDDFEDLFKPEFRAKALNCSTEMVLNALQKADDCLFYLAGIREQSVFNFCAIPQAMAIATLETCFQNPAVFERNVKITKGQACRLMIESTQNLQILCEAFREYARKIHRKNDPRDPNFLNVSIACGRVEQFIQTIFPSQAPVTGADGKPVPVGADGKPLSPEELVRQKAQQDEDKWGMIIVLGGVVGVLVVTSVIMFGLAWFFGARFDLIYAQMRGFNLTNTAKAVTTAAGHAAGREEL